MRPYKNYDTHLLESLKDPGEAAAYLNAAMEENDAELLLVALGGCTGADVVDILRKKRERLTEYSIEVHGEKRDEYPRGFRRIEVKHILRGRGLSEKAVAHAIELSDQKYCSVAATLRPAAEIVTTYEIQEEPVDQA